MRSRAESLGGTFTVESAPGQGTAVAVTLPLPVTGEPLAPREPLVTGEPPVIGEPPPEGSSADRDPLGPPYAVGSRG
jgi:hypothetical protein